ncbi:hypothetical protein AVEN_173949-1, partial [Araneus ventricosus]
KILHSYTTRAVLSGAFTAVQFRDFWNAARKQKVLQIASQNKRGLFRTFHPLKNTHQKNTIFSAEQSKRGALYAVPSLHVSRNAASRDWSNGKNNSPSSRGLRESLAIIGTDVTYKNVLGTTEFLEYEKGSYTYQEPALDTFYPPAFAILGH